MRSKIRPSKYLLPIPPPPSQLCILPEVVRETGNGGYCQFITSCFCCLLGERSPSPTPVCRPSYAREFSINSSRVHSQNAAMWVSLPQGAAPQGQAAPVWVPHNITGPSRKPLPAQAPLSTGLQVPARTLLQHMPLMSSQTPLRHPPAPVWVFSTG